MVIFDLGPNNFWRIVANGVVRVWLGCPCWVHKFPSLPIGFRGLCERHTCRFVGHVDLRYQRTFRDPPVGYWNSNWDAQKHVSVFEAMAMYEHLLSLDSVFCPILSFGLEDMLFRIALSDEVCD